MRLYSTVEIVRMTDATYRQVDYWLRLGVLQVVSAGGNEPGSGKQRRFDEREVRIIAVCARLAELRCPLTPTLRLVAQRLREVDALDGLLFVRQDGSIARTPEGSGWLVDLSEFGFEDALA